MWPHHPVRHCCSKARSFQTRFAGEAVEADSSGRQQDVGVRVASVAAVVGDVGHHAGGHELIADEVANQLAALWLGQFDRQRDLDLAGELFILAPLGGLDLVPEAGAVV